MTDVGALSLNGLLSFNGCVVQVLKEALLKVEILGLSLFGTLNGVSVQGTILLNQACIFGDLDAEQFIVAFLFHSLDDALDVVHLLNFLFELLLRLLDILNNLEHLLIVLKEEGEVLGPGQEGGIWLADLVIIET